jgi:hypothetical protein
MSIDPRTVARERGDSDSIVHDWRSNPAQRSRDLSSHHRGAPDQSLAGRLTAGGTAGNERLTTITGIVLLVLLAAIGVTILRLGSLLWLHLFVGMLLIGPIALKLASTGYRFVRYYTANPRYRRKGPPAAPLRIIAPMVVLSTVVVLVTGVLLLTLGPSSRSTLLPLHKISFFVWIAFTSLHVLGHLPEVAAAVGLGERTTSKIDVLSAVSSTDRGDLSARRAPSATLAACPGRSGRGLSLATALAGGTVLAILFIPRFEPWLHMSRHIHHH